MVLLLDMHMHGRMSAMALLSHLLLCGCGAPPDVLPAEPAPIPVLPVKILAIPPSHGQDHELGLVLGPDHGRELDWEWPAVATFVLTNQRHEEEIRRLLAEISANIDRIPMSHRAACHRLPLLPVRGAASYGIWERGPSKTQVHEATVDGGFE